MKKLVSILFPLLIVFIFAACNKSDDNPTEPANGDVTAANYYPGGIGSNFLYGSDSVTAGTGNFVVAGERTTSFERNETYAGTEYIVQKNVISAGSGPSIQTELLFRRTDAGIYFLVDTSGISGILSDSLISALNLDVEIDDEIIGFSYPLEAGKSWSAFKLNVSIGSLITITVVEVKAEYVGTEEIFVEAAGGNKTAEKLKYIVVLKLPSPDNPLVFNTQEYSAFSWYVKDIGLAKLEGNSLIINTMSGGGINFADSSGVVRQSLKSYELK